MRDSGAMRFDAIKPGPPLTPDVLDAYCVQHGIELPTPLRSQLLEQNGGAPRAECLVHIPNHGVEVVFDFFGIGMSDISSELAWNIETLTGRLPPGMIPFADDPGGNFYVLDQDGAVWFWDHELEGDTRAVTRVSDSFEAFLDALTFSAG
jgi:hypothetical protein